MSEFDPRHEQAVRDELKKQLLKMPRTMRDRNKFGDCLHIASGGLRPKDRVDLFISECEQFGLITTNKDGSILNNCAAQPDFGEEVMPSSLGWGADRPDLSKEEHMPDDLSKKYN